jgi:hypothetical protein
MKKITLIMGIIWASISIQAQTAEEVVEKYNKALGGIENWKKLESIRQTGYVIVQGMNIPFTASSMRPNLTRQEGNYQGQKIIDAFDGTVAWQSNPWQTSNQPVKKTEEETMEAAKEVFEDDFIDYKTKGHSVELEGTEEIDSTKCFKLILRRKAGDVKTYFIDAQKYLPLMVRTVSTSGPNKGQSVETVMSDYKNVDGLMIPHTLEQKLNGQTGMIIKTEKTELNPTFDKAIFSFPKE